MNATTKTKKPAKLSLTSRAKSPRRSSLMAAIEAVVEQVPAGPGLDSDAAVPAETIGEVVEPAARAPKKAKPARAKKAEKAREPATEASAAVLVREPGRGWFHIELDGSRVGMLFSTTARVADGHGGTKPARRWAASARCFGRDIRTDAPSRQEALAAFVAEYRA